MENPLIPAQQPLAAPQPARVCAYCGARLNPQFYFCTTCATPYKSHQSVLSPVAVATPTDEFLIQQKAPHVWPLFWTYLAVVLGTSILGYFAFGESRPDLTVILSTAALFIATCVFAATHWPSLAAQFKRFGFFHWAAWAGLAALVPLLAINFLYHNWVRSVMDQRSLSDRLAEVGLSDATVIFFFCVCPAILEEVAFRGLVQHWLQVALRPWKAIVVASALFTALHFSVVSFPYLFAVGMVLGWAKWKTGSLYPSILIHFLHNFVVLELFR